MKYIVICEVYGKEKELGVKPCMDDALDLVSKLEGFDKAEGFSEVDKYTVKIVKEA